MKKAVNSNQRMMLLGGVAVLALVVAYFAGAFSSSEPVKPSIQVSRNVERRGQTPNAANAPSVPQVQPGEPPMEDVNPDPAAAISPATQPLTGAPSTQPLAGSSSTQPIAAAPGSQPSTNPTGIAEAPGAVSPATQPLAQGTIVSPATNPAAPASPATGPAIAEGPATQPSTNPAIDAAVAVAPQTQPATSPAVAVAPGTNPASPSTNPASPAIAEAPSTNPAVAAAPSTTPASPSAVVADDGRTPAMRAALARLATQPAATQPATPVVAASTDSRSSSRSSTGSSKSSRSREVTGGAPTVTVTSSKPFKMEKPIPMPEEYAPVLARSIFSKDRPAIRYDRPDGSSGSGGGFLPSAAARAESRVALRGLVVEDDDALAFLENLDTGTPEVRHLGEKVAQGKIIKIGFTDLVYEAADGQQRTVKIGYTFDGQQAQTATSFLANLPSTSSSSGSTPPAPGSPAPAPGSTPAPGASPATGSQPTGAAASIIEAMKRRRAEQGGR